VRPLVIRAEPQNITVDAAKSALLIARYARFRTRGGWLSDPRHRHQPEPKPIQPLAALIEVFGNNKPGGLVNWGVRGSVQHQPFARHAHNRAATSSALQRCRAQGPR
jgi:hypothetical protein